MSTQQSNPQLEQALQTIPQPFREKIINSYLKIREAFEESNFDDLSSLRSAKFCEAVLRFLQFHLTGSYIDFGKSISNFTLECRKLEQVPKTAGTENLRLIIPKALDFAITIRNKRDVGHLAGDVDANRIDAATLVRTADWVLCELMREFRSMPLEDAQELLDGISVRQIPSIWTVVGKKRILASTIDFKSQTLVLLHSELKTGVLIEDLKSWVEYNGRMSDFKRWVLAPLHKSRLIEFDTDSETAILSPTGAKKVEDELLPLL